ncbi:MAG TPA: UDP-N-acetylmuramoyl-L-alanine--D-glutamate ligase, partial [Candidatus Paceibacterota bacterium]|nr:UDP-N-acetylmuramoyl-L-alanine--D-glutamate ligase [Candidatus Paceibacterota bacterium]
NGADLIVTDLKTKEDLADSLKKIKKALKPEVFKKIKFVLGEHKLENFKNRDFILKAAGAPLDSPFVAEARKNNIPIKMDASWFAELTLSAVEGLKIIGVTGTRGKSTVTHLIHEIIEPSQGLSLRGSQRRVLGKVHLGGNVRGLATLPLLKKVKAEDIVVMELDSWQLQGFGDSKISPNISVFTNLMVDHQNYYSSMDKYFADKANIFLNQKEGDSLVCGKEVLSLIRKKFPKHSGRAIVPDAGVVPKSWKVKLLGEHNRLNIAYAVTVARILDIPEKIIKTSVENYAGVPGRLEFVREVKGIKYYNDTTATTPDGVIAALKALSPQGLSLRGSQRRVLGDIILIGGGKDKELDYKKYAPVVKKSVKSLALFAGTGSDKIIKALGNTKLPARIGVRGGPVEIFDNMPSAFAWANGQAKKGDIVLLSPGAASFGIFKNEFDRGDQFVAQVKKLK